MPRLWPAGCRKNFPANPQPIEADRPTKSVALAKDCVESRRPRGAAGLANPRLATASPQLKHPAA